MRLDGGQDFFTGYGSLEGRRPRAARMQDIPGGLLSFPPAFSGSVIAKAVHDDVPQGPEMAYEETLAEGNEDLIKYKPAAPEVR